MRSFLKNIAAALAIVFFAAAFYVACEQQQKPTALSSPDWAPIDSSDSDLMPAALRVVPGRSWQLWRQSDSTFALLSQDTSGDGLESIVREDSLFAWLMTKLPDSLDLTSYADTLRVSNDTLYISGQETGIYIGNETFFVDDPTEIMDQAFALNRRIIVEPTGAQYVVKASAVSGYATDTVAVVPTGARFAQLQPDGPMYNAKHFGATGDDATDDSEALQAAINYSNGVDLFIPDGRYIVATTLTLKRAQGAMIRGNGNRRYTHTTGTQIKYTGSSDAITITGAGTESLLNRLRISDLTITGTNSGRHGINMDIAGGALLGGIIEKVTVDSFRSAASFGLHLSKCYNLRVSDCRIVHNTSGIRLYNECVNANINNSWITPVDSIGVEVDYPTCRMYGGIIDNSSAQPTGQVGIRANAGFVVDGVLFEDLDKAIEVTATADYFHTSNLHMNTTDNPSTVADGVDAIFENCYISQDIYAGLGTTWSGIHGISSAQIVPPTITGNNPVGLSTITFVQGTAQFTLAECSTPGLRAGQTFTLIMKNDSCAIADEANGSVYFRTQDMRDFDGYNNDRITFVADTDSSDNTIQLTEVNRYRSNSVRTHTASYTVPAGNHGMTFVNQGASGNITFTLPADVNESLTFIATAATHTVTLTPAGTDRLRGYSSGSGMTLSPNALVKIIKSNQGGVGYWDILDASGKIVSVAGKGLVQGMEYQQLTDSIQTRFTTTQATLNYRIANNRGYQSRKSDGTTWANVLLLDNSDNLIVGQTDQNDLYLRAGSFSHATSGDDIFLDAGSATRMRVNSTGEVWIASGTDQGAYNLQVTGDSYLSGTLNLGTVLIRTGTGSPESVVTAVVGSMFLRTDGGAGTTLYIKESGTGNTGWVAK
jgi:hypothetical protein